MLTDDYMEAFRRAQPDPDKVRVWINALRSGRYTQCRGEFSMNGRHCCLAVLVRANGEGGGHFQLKET